jgi:DNA-directed RNA polymerase subunit RPC12/RpoP
MTDIFDTTIICKACDKKMKPIVVSKYGSELRTIQCEKCNDKIIHPSDLNALEKFNNIRGKTYNVKLRVVGNSHAISIPKEIVNFVRQQEKMMDNMVRLCFEDMGKLSLHFRNLNGEKY